MKNKILIFLIGILAGAVISTGIFAIYSITNKPCSDSNIESRMNGGQPPEMPNNGNGQPPEKPNGEEPPEKPNENSNGNQKQLDDLNEEEEKNE